MATEPRASRGGSTDPSSGASRHLLPQGEKGSRLTDLRQFENERLEPRSPSPLEGEGAERSEAGEGSVGAPKARSEWRTAKTGRLRRFAKSMRRNETPHERQLWGILRDRRFNGFKFRRQVPIGSYVVDFFCPAANLIVEVDGSQHADSNADRVRDEWLARAGYRVLRIWNSELNENRNGVGEAIWAALAVEVDPSSGASRHLLPQGEKGPQEPRASVRGKRQRRDD